MYTNIDMVHNMYTNMDSFTYFAYIYQTTNDPQGSVSTLGPTIPAFDHDTSYSKKVS